MVISVADMVDVDLPLQLVAPRDVVRDAVDDVHLSHHVTCCEGR